MAMRTAAGVVSGSSLCRIIMNDGIPRTCSLLPRFFSDDGRVLDKEERAQENIYIKKMERENIEKQKMKMDKESAEKEKEAPEKKSKDGTQKD